jgi:hypothetical protein
MVNVSIYTIHGSYGYGIWKQYGNMQIMNRYHLVNILENEFYLFWGSIGQYAGCTFCLQVTDVFVATPPQHVCAFAHGFLYIYIHIQTRDIDMQHYVLYIYTTESLYMHTYHISIYPVHINVTIDSLVKSIVSASLYLHVQDRQGLSDIKGVVTAAFQHHSMHCCDTFGETWWAPPGAPSNPPGKCLALLGWRSWRQG